MGDSGESVQSLRTLQFHVGGLLDAVPTDEAIHLVRSTKRGTPGPTLCGIDRFAPDCPGFSVGGGISGGAHEHHACEPCVEVWRTEFPGLVVFGMFQGLFPLAALSGSSGEEGPTP